MVLRQLKFGRRHVWGLAFAISIIIFASNSAYAIESGGVGGKPANPREDNPRSQSIFVHTIEPEKEAKDSIQIFNNTDKEKTISVYSVDSQIASGGTFACAQAADEKKAVSNWIKLSKDRVTLKPNTSEKVDFTIKVPKDAPVGESNGCIAIQEVNQTPIQSGNGIALSLRSAVRVAVTVPGDISKVLSFANLNLERVAKDKLMVHATLHNGGNVSLDTSLNISLRTLIWTEVFTVGGTFPVLAGTDADYNFEAKPPFWGGFYFLSARATYNPDVKAELGIENESRSIVKNEWVFIKPHPLAAVIEIIAFLIVIGAVSWFVLRRRRSKSIARNSVSHKVHKDENIQSIAEEYGANWKMVARINKLKAPYLLKPGQVIKVPSNKNRTKKSSSAKEG